MIERIRETDADWLFVLDEMYEFIENFIDETRIKNMIVIPVTNSLSRCLAKTLYIKSKAYNILKSVHTINCYSYNEFIKWGRTYTGSFVEEYENDTAVVMVYSSGTTGASKGILLTNESINAIIQNYKRDTFYGKRTDSFLAMIPVWFSTGIVLSLIMPLAHGVCVIPEIQFSKEIFARDLIKYKPSMALTATSLWLYVSTAEETKHIDLSCMTYPSTGGEKISEKDEIMLNNFLKTHGCKVSLLKGYGMCELGSEITGTTASEGYSSKPGSTGYPILNAVVSAFNVDTNEELKYMEPGELRVCTPAHMKGYYKNPEATAAFFKKDKEGRLWGCTGDLGYVDEDGEVFVLGRVADSYKLSGGETVYMFEIEDVIMKEAAVSQCKVVDIIENGIIKLVAHLVLKEGTNNPDEVITRIISNVSTELSDQKRPNYYKIRSSMPVHSNGKRDIGVLKEDRENLVSVEEYTILR